MRKWQLGATAVVALLVGIGAGGLLIAPLRAAKVAPAPVQTASLAPIVKVAAAEKRDLPLFASGVGHVQALNTAMVKSRIDGPIERVFFTEGEQVAAGKPLFQIDQRPYRAALGQAEGQLARDQAQYAAAKTDYERAVGLVDSGFIARQTLEQREALMAGYAAAIKIDEAALDNARLNLDFTTIRAPISGRIGKRLVDSGNLVHPSDNTPLAEIVQTRPISALFTVPQGTLAAIRAEMQSGSPDVEAFSTDDRHSIGKGRLALIGNSVDQLSGTVELKASFDNEDEALWPGQLIEARLTLARRDNIVAIPSSAVSAGPDGKIVFVLDDHKRISVRKVSVGPASDGKSIIESGLRPGEQVVIEKLDLLTPGLEVRTEAAVAGVS